MTASPSYTAVMTTGDAGLGIGREKRVGKGLVHSGHLTAALCDDVVI